MFSFRAIAVIKNPDQKHREGKDLVALQFQVTIHHCREDKGRSWNCWSHHVHSQEQRENKHFFIYLSSTHSLTLYTVWDPNLGNHTFQNRLGLPKSIDKQYNLPQIYLYLIYKNTQWRLWLKLDSTDM